MVALDRNRLIVFVEVFYGALTESGNVLASKAKAIQRWMSVFKSPALRHLPVA